MREKKKAQIIESNKRKDMAKFTELFGESIKSKDGSVVSSSLQTKSQVGIYFSAHWCPPCRGFTPRLVETYNAIKEAGKDFEIVFVSSDRDEGAFDEYYSEMPWLALPFADRDRKSALSKMFKVQGIPTFVLLDNEGNVVTKKGRDMVSNDPTGTKFPWIPPTLQGLVGTEFVSADGSTSGVEAVSGKPIGLYFSAHWCGPCRGFTPKLAETYRKLKAEGTDMEIIFVSADREKQQFDEYLSEMPWKAIPYENREAEKQLSSMFEVEGIPSLIILESLESGRIINSNAVGSVSSDPTGSQFPWWPRAVNDLNEVQDNLGDAPCLIAFMENADAIQKIGISEAIQEVARPYNEEFRSSGKDPKFYFFIVQDGGRCSDHFRNLSDITGKGTQLILLDIPDSGGFYQYDDIQSGVTAESVRAFLSEYESKTLVRKQLERR